MSVKFTLRVHFILNDKRDVHEVTGRDHFKISAEAMEWWDAMEDKHGSDFRFVSIDWHRHDPL